MGIRYETLGQSPNHRRIVIADTEAELLASTPGCEIAEGYAKDTGINADYVQGVGWKVGGATKNPDGSTSFAGLLNVAGGVVADGAPIRAAIDGPITLSTFGDSTDTVWIGHTTNPGYVGNDYTDRSAIPAVIPASGTDVLQFGRSSGGLLWHGHDYRFLANGGIPGEATSTIIARGAAAAAENRKSMHDVAALGARVCIVNGLSINNIQSLADGSDNTAVDTMISSCAEIIRYLASRHEMVIWTGIFGFNNTAFTASRVAMIRGMIIRSHAAMAIEATKHRNVVWVDPVGLTCDETGAWLPGVADTGSTTHLHLSVYGAMVHARKLRSILDARYDCRMSQNLYTDTLYSWLNPSASRPAGVTVTALGSAVLGTYATANGIFTIPFATVSDSSGVQLLFDGIESWLAGGVSGDKFRLCYDYDILDANGNYLSTHQAQSDIRLTAAGQGTVDLQQPYCWIDGHRGLSTYVFALDRDVSALASGCTAWLLIKPMAGIGSFTLRVYPPKVYKL